MKKCEWFLLMVVLCLVSFMTSCNTAEPKSETLPTSNFQQERETTPAFQENQEEIRIRQTDGMKVVFVPGGDFLMGSTKIEIEDAIALCQQYYNRASVQRCVQTSARRDR